MVNHVISVFLLRDDTEVFYCCINNLTPQNILEKTLTEITRRKKCQVRTRVITSTGTIVEGTYGEET